MDPFSCLAIAGTLVQFLDFGGKLIAEFIALSKDGKSTIRDRAEESSNDLNNFSIKLEQALCASGESSTLTTDELALKTLCGNCQKLAGSLTEKMKVIQVTGKGKSLNNFRSALATIWSKREIEGMQEQLNEYRQAIDTRILAVIRSSINALSLEQTQRFLDLDRGTKAILLGLTDLKNSLQEEVKSQMMAAAQLINRQEVVVTPSMNVGSRHAIDACGDRMADQRVSAEDLDAAQVFLSRENRLRQAVSVDILESLRFSMITERFDEVNEAHHDTFQWIFRHPADDPEHRQWEDFVEWLQHGDGLFWINGKAGCGKSTLMKFICNHHLTKEHLEVWRGDMDLHIAKFFFWNIGTGLQKSQIGLLRSLLYDILSAVPELVPILFPSQWGEIYLRKVKLPAGVPGTSWNLSNLKRAFENLLNQKVVPMKLCLFVDGLDEYSGLNSEVAKIFQMAALAPNVKVCASSRPMPVFLESFERHPQVRLHDLTQNDIKRYVLDMLQNNDRMQSRAKSEPDHMASLVKEIVGSAAGVFLWVRLIVMDLLRGLENHDSISQLQHRLRILPTDLEELYEHMVFRVDKVYTVEAARFYQLVAAATESKDDWRPTRPLTMFTFALAEEEDHRLAFNAPSMFLSNDSIQQRITDMEVRLRSRCGGLLEPQFGGSSLRKVQPYTKVSYIHRTVKDYLEGRGIRHILSDRTGGVSMESFNPHVALLTAYILELKCLEAIEKNAVEARILVDNVITFARRAEADLCQPQLKLMDAFFQTATKWFQSACSEDLLPDGESTISLAVQCGLHQFLQAKIAAEKLDPNNALKRPLLDYAVNPSAAFTPFLPRLFNSLSKPTVIVLLQFQADPNCKTSKESQSPWQNALTFLASDPYRFLSDYDKETLLRRWGSVLKALLQYGADGAAMCQGPPTTVVEQNPSQINRHLVETIMSAKELINMIFEDLPEVKSDLAAYLPGKVAPKIITKNEVTLNVATLRQGAALAARPCVGVQEIHRERRWSIFGLGKK